MSDAPATSLEILIDIRAKLDALVTAQAGLRSVAQDAKDAHESASELGSLFAHGLGIGSGMELARRAVDLFRDSFTEAVRLSSQLAAEVERAHGRLGLQGEAYQTLATEARAAGTDFQEMTSSMAQFRQRLGDALLDPQAGSVLRQLGLDAQQLASLAPERQLEKVSVALGKVSDGNVRARLTQELFGRGAAAMAPLLEKLRTEGYDRLRESARETNTILGDDTAAALSKAARNAEEAQQRLGVALAPLNLKLIEAKTQLVNLLARNSGAIQSGLEASFAGTFTAAIEKALEKIEKSGGLEAALKNFGKTLAGPVGVGLATALGAFIIKELERRALEANARQNAFADSAARTPFQIEAQIPAVQNEDQLRALYNKAVTTYQQAVIERQKLLRTAGRSEDQDAQIEALNGEIQHLGVLIPKIKEKGRVAIETNRAQIDTFAQLKDAQLDLMVIDVNHQNFQNSAFHTAEQMQNNALKFSSHEEENRQEDVKYLANKIALLTEILDLTKKLPLKPGDDPADRAQEITKLRAQLEAAHVQYRNTNAPLSDASKLRDQFKAFNAGTNSAGGDRLSAGQGAGAGAQQWVMSLGTQGEQVAAALQSSIGATVSSISEGIYGWATGTATFGDTVRNLGSTLFKTFLDTIVQMGVQWVINAALAKGSLISTFLVAAGLRKAETADVIGNETAKTPSIMANAAGSSISSFGIAAAVGIAALLAVMAAFGGFRESGGDARAGRAYVVGEKRAEVFVPDENGTILPSLDSLSVPAPARARSVAGGAPVGSSLRASSGATGAAQKPQRHIVIVPDLHSARALQRDPNFENVIVDVMQRRKGEILG